VKPWADFTLRTGAAFVVALVVSPMIGPLWPATSFHRVMTRTFQAAMVIALLVHREAPRTWPSKFRAMGFRGPDRLRRVLLGAGTGLFAMTLLLVVSWLLGGRSAAPPHRLAFLGHLSQAIATAVVVGCFEEIFFRGYLKDAIRGFPSAALYSIVHFLTPISKTAPAGSGYDPLLALKRLPELNAWTDRRQALLGIPCLLIFGLALNRLRDRTGTLYLGMGVHAGVVFVLAFYGRFLDVNSTNPWIFGGVFARDGLLPLLALLLLLLASYRAPLPPWARRA